jgi:tetratricopeptide (TPR) repeat protein
MLEEHRYYEALRLVDARIKQAPHNLNFRLVRAMILREENSFESAEAEYRHVLNSTRTTMLRAQAFSGLGMAFYKQGLTVRNLGDQAGFQAKMDEAAQAYQQALTLVPYLPEAWLGKAQLAITFQNAQEARTALGKVRLSRPENQYLAPALEVAKGRLLLLQGSVQEAFGLAAAAKHKFPDSIEVYLLHGQVCYELERYDDAIIQFKKVLDRTPRNADALKWLSAAYERKMRVGDAEFTLQKAVTLNPFDLEAARGLLKLYEQQQDPERSITLLQALLKNPMVRDFSTQTDLPIEVKTAEHVRRTYQQELLARLYGAQRWKAVYNLGLELLTEVAGEQDGPEGQEVLTGYDREIRYFATAAYIQHRAEVERAAFLDTPLFQRLMTYFDARLQDAADRETAYWEGQFVRLLLNPLAEVTLPEFSAEAPWGQTSSFLLKLTFLKGEWEGHQALLDQLAATPQEALTEDTALLGLAQELLQLRDYEGAKAVAKVVLSHPPATPDETAVADRLQQNIQEQEQAASEQLLTLKLLSRKIPPGHWQKTAEEALGLFSGNPSVHALVAKTLMSRKQLEPALLQQRLAAQYAKTPREKRYWEHQAEKTEKALQRQKSLNQTVGAKLFEDMG